MSDAAARPLRSDCPLSAALDRFGDRWTLLILRDIAAGKRRYGDIAGSSEIIPTNILASRLKQMQADGLIESVPYQSRPVRSEYHLTAKGRSLIPIMQELCRWGLTHEPETRPPSGVFMMLKP